MSEGVIIAIISAIGSLIVGIVSAVISARATGNDVQKKMEIQMAVMDTKLDELTREVREHNNFAKRVPVIEAKVEALEKAAQKN